jgi:hypothetical protein
MKTFYEYNDTFYENLSTLIEEEFPVNSEEFRDYLIDNFCCVDELLGAYLDGEENKTVKDIVEDYYCAFTENICDIPDNYNIIMRELI